MSRSAINKIQGLRVLAVCVTLVLTISCKNKDRIPNLANNNDQNLKKQEELDALRSERDQLIEELTLQRLAQAEEIALIAEEKDRLTNEKIKVEDEITLLRQQLDDGLTPEERAEVEAQLAEAEESRATLQEMLDEVNLKYEEEKKRADELQARVAELESRVAELEARVQELEAELASEKAKNGTVDAGETDEDSEEAGAQAVDNTVFQFVAANAGGCLDASGNTLSLMPCQTTNKNQHFFATNAATKSEFPIKSATGGMCLGVSQTQTGSSRAIVFNTCRLNDASQIWQFDERRSTNVKLMNKSSGLCLNAQQDDTLRLEDCDTKYTLFDWGMPQSS